MKIIGVETLQLEEHGNLLWVRLHTDEGNCHVNTGPLAALDIFRSCYA